MDLGSVVSVECNGWEPCHADRVSRKRGCKRRWIRACSGLEAWPVMSWTCSN